MRIRKWFQKWGSEWGGEVFLSLVAFGVYRWAAAPSIGWIDSGAIAAAARTLGIANPPGFPSYMVLAWLWGHAMSFVSSLFRSFGIPFGNWLVWLQVLSHVGAIALGVVVSRWTREIVAELFPEAGERLAKWAGWWAMSVLLFSYSVWSQAMNVETFTLTYALVYVIAFCAWKLGERWDKSTRGNSWQILGLAVLGGLTLGFNPTSTVLVPATAWWLWRYREALLKRWQWVVAALVIGLVTVTAVYSYLPLRAMTQPDVNWGNPNNPERLWAHLTAAGLNIYDPTTNAINGFTGSPLVAVQSLRNYVASALNQFTPIIFLVSLIGWWTARRSSAFSWLIGLVGMNLAWVMMYYGGNQESWMISSWAAWAIAAGIGAVAIWQEVAGKSKTIQFGLALLAIVPLVFWWPVLNHHSQWYTQDYLDNMWRVVPENAVVIGGGDIFNSLAYYQRLVLNERTDAITITGNMFYIFPWYRQEIAARTGLTISPALEEKTKVVTETGFTETIDQLIADNPGRRFFITPLMLRESIVAGTDKGVYNSKKFELRPAGLLFEIVPAGQPITINPDEYAFTFRQSLTGKSPYFLERNYGGSFATMRQEYADAWLKAGEVWQKDGDLEKVETALKKAVEFGPETSGVYQQRMGVFLAEQGKLTEAEPWFNEALNREPQNPSILENTQIFQQQRMQDKDKLVIAEFNEKTKTWSPGIWEQPAGLVQGKIPPGWVADKVADQIKIFPITGGVEVAVRLLPVRSEVELDTWLTETAQAAATQSAILKQSGSTMIPSTMGSQVRIWRDAEGKEYTEFILPRPTGVLQIEVRGSLDQWKEVLDSLLVTMQGVLNQPENDVSTQPK